MGIYHEPHNYHPHEGDILFLQKWSNRPIGVNPTMQSSFFISMLFYKRILKAAV